MSDDRKPLLPWIVTLLIGLPVIYVASFGPACWLTDEAIVPDAVTHRVFGPLAWAAARCPNSIRHALVEYCEIGRPERGFVGTGWIMIEVAHSDRRIGRWPRL